jgi:ERCC4-type nuclease
MLLIAPTEPTLLRNLGTTSPLPEVYGTDFLFPSPHGFVGIQRKEVKDLVASIRGDRIARELGQSSDLYRTVLLIEGDWEWNRDGVSRRVEGFNRAQYDGLCLSFQDAGWYILASRTLHETAEMLGRIQTWFQKADHNSLRTRPKSNGMWGTARNRDFGIHVLQGFDGLGIGNAGKVYDHFGTIPLYWTVTEKELLAVPGIGKVRARKLLDALSPPSPAPSD